MAAKRDVPFYVGYLRLPRDLRGFLIRLVIAFLVIDIALALFIFVVQKPRASGAWGIAGEAYYSGRFSVRPYPLLRVPAEGGGSRIVFIISEGKIGAPPGLEDFDGAQVTVGGYPLQRGDLTLLQLAEPPDRREAAGPAPPDDAAATDRTMTGEIMDSKCWAGAMNPGEGKEHKSCAGLCMLGGLPILFVVGGPGGEQQWYLLTDKSGEPIEHPTSPFIGDQITVSGTVAVKDGLPLFEVDPATLGFD
ncbi:MAG: hypothetical protein WDN69_29635 [Aliidongia sp.]